MEKWDLFDENRKPLNKTHKRGDEMKVGEYHTVVVIWTVNNKHEILLTLRHPNKEAYPNLWENTGGSVLSRETSLKGAVRELFEETGIVADENELILLGTEKENSAFIDTYIVRKNVDISELTMQEGETIDAQWVSLDILDEMIKSGEIAIPISRRLIPLRDKFESFVYSEAYSF